MNEIQKKLLDELAGPEPTIRPEAHCIWRGRIEGYNAMYKHALPLQKSLELDIVAFNAAERKRNEAVKSGNSADEIYYTAFMHALLPGKIRAKMVLVNFRGERE